MDQNKEVIKKFVAMLAFLSIAVSIFLLAPPASRLFVALLALPVESLILVSLFDNDRRRSTTNQNQF